MYCRGVSCLSTTIQWSGQVLPRPSRTCVFWGVIRISSGACCYGPRRRRLRRFCRSLRGARISCAQAAFPRAFELLNKTNQFNTTGARWSLPEAERFFAIGGVYYVMEVADRFTEYGLVGVMCVNGYRIEQFAMSCRVIGLEVEVAQVAYVLDLLLKRGEEQAIAKVIETDANLVSRDIWKRCGFLLEQDDWIRDLSCRLAVPSHITLSKGDLEA